MFVDPMSLHGCMDWYWSALYGAVEFSTSFKLVRIDKRAFGHALSFEVLIVADKIQFVVIACTAGIMHGAAGVKKKKIQYLPFVLSM